MFFWRKTSFYCSVWVKIMEDALEMGWVSQKVQVQELRPQNEFKSSSELYSLVFSFFLAWFNFGVNVNPFIISLRFICDSMKMRRDEKSKRNETTHWHKQDDVKLPKTLNSFGYFSRLWSSTKPLNFARSSSLSLFVSFILLICLLAPKQEQATRNFRIYGVAINFSPPFFIDKWRHNEWRSFQNLNGQLGCVFVEKWEYIFKTGNSYADTHIQLCTGK